MIQGPIDFPATELRLRHLLEGKTALEPELGQTLLLLHDWAILALDHGPDEMLNVMQLEPAGKSRKPVAGISERLSVNVQGVTRDLLRKSLQEALFCSVETEGGLSQSEFAGKLVELLRRQGASPFLRRFLSLHVFNVVWFRTQECFRGLARTNDLFTEEMENVQRTCRQIVDSEWKTLGIRCPLHLSSAESLIDCISHRLCG